MSEISNGRVGALIAGAAFFTQGFFRRSPLGWISTAVGGALLITALKTRRARTGDAKPVVWWKTVTVGAGPVEAYQAWRGLENVAEHVPGIRVAKGSEANRQRWSVPGKFGLPVTWQTEIVNERPGRWIEWRSVEGSPVDARGSIRFTKKKGGRGTKVHIQLAHTPSEGFSAEAFHQALSSAVR